MLLLRGRVELVQWDDRQSLVQETGILIRGRGDR